MGQESMWRDHNGRDGLLAEAAREGASGSVITRLTPQDASFYRLESSSNPIHIGSLAILQNTTADSGDGHNKPVLDYDRLVDLVESRLSLVPRYRRKVREIPLSLGRPVWVEDSRFDINYHIRRSALPAPGTDEQLHELVARLSSRPLDQGRPLWEMYLIEGLSGGRCAIFTKSHSALVDGEGALEIGHVILDAGTSPRGFADDAWCAPREPSDIELLVGALTQLAYQPSEAIEVLREAGSSGFGLIGAAGRAVDSVVSTVRSVTTGAPDSPLNARTSRQRRFDVVTTGLEDYRKIKRRFDCSINDAILAVVTGALRNWLLSRGEALVDSSVLRAVVPMSVYVDGADHTRNPAGEVSSFLIDLPVGEPNPVIRLSHISHATEATARKPARCAGAHTGASGGVRPGQPARDECAGGEYLRRTHVQSGDHQRAGSADADVRRRRADAGDVSGVAVAA